MGYDPNQHHRRSIRLQGYDYSQTGLYFVTICMQNRACLLGEIQMGQMQLNSAGEMIYRWWSALPNKFPSVVIDAFVVMPNHVHGIIIITDNPVGADLCVCPDPDNNTQVQGAHAGAPLPTIVQWFKTMTTNEYIRGVKNLGWEPFNKRLWQRNYYEHIIRNEEYFQRIREYVHTNPLKWQDDQLHPNVSSKW